MVTPVADVLGTKFYRIERVKYVGFNHDLEKRQHKQEYRLIRNMEKFVGEYFYYAQNSDITLSLQRVS